MSTLVGANTKNLAVPYYEPGSRLTCRNNAAVGGATILGKRFVSLAADKDPGSRELDPTASGGNIRIKQAVADDPLTYGVAEHDCLPQKVTVVFTDGFVVPVTAGVALAFGDYVKPGAGGKAVKAATRAEAYGRSLAAAAVDQDAIVHLGSF